MAEVSRAIDAIKKRQARGAPTIADALLGLAPYRYIVHRLRYYTANRIYLVGLHVLEFMILMRMIPYQSLGELIVFVHGLSLLTAFCWGVLEGQRRDVHAAATPHAKAIVLDSWFTCALTLCVGLVISWFLLTRYYDFDASASHIGLVFLMRACFDLLSRCRYSGLFAFQRVYRPFPVIVALESLGIVSAAAAVFLFQAENFAILLGASAIISFCVEWSFARRDYERLRIRPPQFRTKYLFRLPNGLLRKESLAHGFYMLSHKASSLYVLLTSYHAYTGALPLVFHLVSPVFNMAANWVHSLYFDFRKYRVSVFQALLTRFSHSVVKVSAAYGLLCAGVGSLLVWTLITWQAHSLIPYLVILMISRAFSGAVVTATFNHKTLTVPLLAILISTGLPAVDLARLDEIDDYQTMTWLIAGQISLALLLLFPKSTAGLAAKNTMKKFHSARHFFEATISKPSRWIQISLDRDVLRRMPLEERLERGSGVLRYAFLRRHKLLLLVSGSSSSQHVRLLLGGCARSMDPLAERERDQLLAEQMSSHRSQGLASHRFKEVATFPSTNEAARQLLKNQEISAHAVLNASRRSFEEGRPYPIQRGYQALAIQQSGLIQRIIILKSET